MPDVTHRPSTNQVQTVKRMVRALQLNHWIITHTKFIHVHTKILLHMYFVTQSARVP